jgi:hypothetical protein
MQGLGVNSVLRNSKNIIYMILWVQYSIGKYPWESYVYDASRYNLAEDFRAMILEFCRSITSYKDNTNER